MYHEYPILAFVADFILPEAYSYKASIVLRLRVLWEPEVASVG